MFQRQLNVSSPRYRDASLSLSKIYIYILLLTKSNARVQRFSISSPSQRSPKPTDQRVSSVESPGQRSVQSPHPPLRTPASRLFTDIVIKCSMKSRVPRHNILRERADAQGARTIATLLRYDENNVGTFSFPFFLTSPCFGFAQKSAWNYRFSVGNNKKEETSEEIIAAVPSPEVSCINTAVAGERRVRAKRLGRCVLTLRQF